MNVPEGWTRSTLDSAISRIQAGFSAPGETRPIQKGEAGVLRTGAVLGGRFDASAHKVVTQRVTDLKVPVRHNTVLLGRKNSAEMVGAAVFIDQDHPRLYLSDLIWELTPSTRADAEWLAYALQNASMSSRIRLAATGTQSTMKNLSRSDFVRLPVDLPPLPEQRKIAEILRTWDDAIERFESLILARNTAMLMRRNHLIDQQPSHELVPLGEVFVERVDRARSDARLLSVTRRQGVVRHSETGRKDSSSSDRSKYKSVLPGDIAYNTMRMWQGASGLVGEEGMVSPAYTVITPVRTRILPQFAAHLIKSERMIFEFQRNSQGITSDTWNLKFPAFARIRGAVPSLPAQSRIANMLDACSAEISLLDRQLELLRTQKRGLMQKLLTGEVRVNVDGGE
ncbi:restriction endonuclease subunit S [uncultured Microbacterium sp.]|uniref:restriction endonuclease subunit S n=1 Tax=uncultured Microbacterium sp. TaxID=191216 RepID=UPI003457581A